MKQRWFRLVVAALAVASVATPVVGAATAPPVVDAPLFKEVGRIPVFVTSPAVTDNSGVVIVNPASRRGYVVTEASVLGFVASAVVPGHQAVTHIRSFDLDTLRPRREALLPGLPVAGGLAPEPAGQNAFSGDVVHAVDAAAKRLYLPMSDGFRRPTASLGPDDKRPLAHVLVLDEEAFDRDPNTAFGAFTLPGSQQRLLNHHLMGMTVIRHGVEPTEPGKVVAVFASPSPLHALPVTSTPIPNPRDHSLVQWAPGRWRADGPPPKLLPSAALPVPADWERILTECGTASLTAGGSSEISVLHGKTQQWGILARPDAVYLACQTAPNAGGVLRVPLDAATGLPGPNGVMASLGKAIGDVMVDEPRSRLVVRSIGGGHTWWTFDAEDLRFSGSVAAHVHDGGPNTAGVDPGTGRLYTFRADTCAGTTPTRGGLAVTEAALDPVPAPQIVVPDLAYHSDWRIAVDPVTRRVFVRRGNNSETLAHRYPNCVDAQRETVPVEPFYRVFEDRIPVAQQPDDLDDSGFTTDVEEADKLTEASFLGSGSGFGARSLFTGGLDALTRGAATTAQSLCGRDDREVLAGSVGKVEVSDQSTLAEAAGLDADARTQQVLGDPVSRCRPQAPPQEAGPRNAEELNECHGDVDVREAAFDQALADGTDDNEDGCTDRDGENRYAARCAGVQKAAAPRFDDGLGHVAPRDGFEAGAECDEEREQASASATGALRTENPEQAGGLTVARSSSNVKVQRKMGKGVTVTVDSVARGIEIPGVGTIGVARAEATSTATGRRRAAAGTFRRTLCDVEVQGFAFSGCAGDEAQLRTVVKRINGALGGRGEARLRSPDVRMARGTEHGYLSAVQRDRTELFADQVLTRDRSLAVPALEIIMYQGDGGAWGAGRQVTQLAGVQASTSYGITCLHGRARGGGCAVDGEEAVAFGELPSSEPGDPVVTTVTEQLPGVTSLVAGSSRENVITRLLRAIPRAVAEALRLLFNNPRELGLLAALWALLYAPCYLGDRRRAVRQIAARRLTTTTT